MPLPTATFPCCRDHDLYGPVEGYAQSIRRGIPGSGCAEGLARRHCAGRAWTTVGTALLPNQPQAS